MERKLAKEQNDTSAQCNCLPACTSITYESELKPWNVKGEAINVKFKYHKFQALERNALFDNMDFWASCGGLFGLFTGFSLISVIEIVYYGSLRWICNVWRFRRSYQQY